MKTILLTKGKVAKVDDIDYSRLCNQKWHVSYKGGKMNHCYAYTTGKQAMHRIVTKCPKGKVVDHINGDTLDNRRSNLRIVAHRTNCINRSNTNTNNTSGYRGVTWNKSLGYWVAQTRVNYKRVGIGYFKTAKEASIAFENYMIELYGNIDSPKT